MDPLIRVIQPISATVFGDASPGQTADTPLRPLSPYACAKAHALYLARYYREKYGMFVSCPILYNHDSPRRGPDYLLQKIARGVKPDGDLTAPVDIGYASEYVEAMWRMLQQDNPTDELIGTGVSYTVGDLWDFGSRRLLGDREGIVRSDILSRKVNWLTPYTGTAYASLGWQATKDAADVLALIIDARRSSDGKGKTVEGEGGGAPREAPVVGSEEPVRTPVLGLVEGPGRAEGERQLPRPGDG